MALRIAVATNDGKTIDEHFGRARSFHIFEVEETGDFRLVEERAIVPQCPGDHGAAHSVDATASQLAGIDAVFVNQIGPGASETVEARGIRAFTLSGPIDRALSAYGKRHKLIKGKTPRTTRASGGTTGSPQEGNRTPGGGCGGPGGCTGCR